MLSWFSRIFIVVAWMVVLPSGVSWAKFDKRISYNYYDVTGVTAKQVLNSLETNGPKGNDGPTYGASKASVSYNSKMSQLDGVCDFEKVDIVLNIQVTLPRWVDKKKASPTLKSAYKNTEKIINKHELKHIEVYERLARKVHKEVLKLPAMSDCEALDFKGDEVVDRVWKERESLQKQLNEKNRKRFRNSKKMTIMRLVSVEKKRVLEKKQQQDTVIEPYVVTGLTVNDLVESLEQKAPSKLYNIDHFGYTFIKDSDITWNVRLIDQSVEAGCEIGEVFISYRIVSRIPSWANYFDAAPHLQKHWMKIEQQVKTHAEGHQNIYVKMFDRLRMAIQNIPVQKSCHDFDAIVENKVQEARRSVVDDVKQYDSDYHKIHSQHYKRLRQKRDYNK